MRTMESLLRPGAPKVDHLASVAPVGAGLPGRSGARPILGAMHDGGEVKKTGVYELEEGETVTPAPGKKRASEYRKVYLARRGKKK